MTIVVRKGAEFKPVTRIYQKSGSVWKEVLLVQVARKNPSYPASPQPLVLVTIFDRYLTPPTGLRGGASSYSSGTVIWDAVPSATDYQVLKRPANNPNATPDIYPSPTIWYPNLSYTISALASNTSYDFTVRARRVVADGNDVISPESRRLRLYTGYPAVTVSNPGYPGALGVAIFPTRSDSYTPDHGWGGNSGGPDVIQGNTVNANGAIHRGAVAYDNAWAQLNNALAPYGQDRFSVTVASATIVRIHRRADGGGATPTLYFYGARCDFGSGPPVAATGANTIAAPAAQTDKDNFTLPNLVDWARAWTQFNIYTPNNGLMLYANDGTGGLQKGWWNSYCVLQNATGIVWQVNLGITWNITTPGAATAWSTP